MTASERDALVANVLDLATQFEVWPEEYAMSPRDGKRHAADLRALVTEVERLTGMGDAYRTTIADYDSRVGALQDEVERLREDAARLDWLNNNLHDFGGGVTTDEHRVEVFIDYDMTVVGHGETLRDAIDAARTTGGRDA